MTNTAHMHITLIAQCAACPLLSAVFIYSCPGYNCSIKVWMWTAQLAVSAAPSEFLNTHFALLSMNGPCIVLARCTGAHAVFVMQEPRVATREPSGR
jgi:hypothetical protein